MTPSTSRRALTEESLREHTRQSDSFWSSQYYARKAREDKSARLAAALQSLDGGSVAGLTPALVEKVVGTNFEGMLPMERFEAKGQTKIE
ncbi:hypothetical protein FQN53_004436 [Emmonsiellopsis sp. PD_33]|nr:hypothetical protein FQN53_004436 [Emmonsiellopsis sp. PD_33]